MHAMFPYQSHPTFFLRVARESLGRSSLCRLAAVSPPREFGGCFADSIINRPSEALIGRPERRPIQIRCAAATGGRQFDTFFSGNPRCSEVPVEQSSRRAHGPVAGAGGEAGGRHAGRSDRGLSARARSPRFRRRRGRGAAAVCPHAGRFARTGPCSNATGQERRGPSRAARVQQLSARQNRLHKRAAVRALRPPRARVRVRQARGENGVQCLPPVEGQVRHRLLEGRHVQ